MPKQKPEDVLLEEMACALYEGRTLPDRLPWGNMAQAMKRQWIEEVRERLAQKEEE